MDLRAREPLRPFIGIPYYIHQIMIIQTLTWIKKSDEYQMTIRDGGRLKEIPCSE